MNKMKFYLTMWIIPLLLVMIMAGCDERSGLNAPELLTTPTISSTNPVNAAVNVPFNQKITATFSEVMDSLTITTATFTVMQGASFVSGTVSYTGITVTFAPLSNLDPNTPYTVTITTMAKSLQGRALASNYVFGFTTGSAALITPPSVSATDPLNAATGVPINQKIAAMFSVSMDASSITASTFTLKIGATPVSGFVSYSGLSALFAPTANLEPNTAYTATITTGAKDLAGNTLASNYVFTFTTGAAIVVTPPVISSTDPSNLETGVAVNQKIAATFSKTMDASTITTASFTLMQGSTFVSGTVSYIGTTAIYSPTSNLTLSTTYTATITTLAKDLAGNALSSNYVWTFTTGAVAVITPPTVSSTDPLNVASGVSLNQKIAAMFSKTMDASTLTTATFTLRQGLNPVPGFVSYTGTTATFASTGNLTANTTYTATITTGAKDLAGNALVNNFVWSFTTGAAVVITPPQVSSTDPLNAATGVALNQKIAVTFSKTMDASTITASTFTLKQGVTSVSGFVSYTGSTATFSPASNLVSNTVYTATVTSSAKDLAGNALQSNFVWSFTSGTVAIITPPTVSSTDPANAVTGVVLNQKIAATFSKTMDATTITTATFTLKAGISAVSGFVSYSGTTALFTPAIGLSPNTVYTATITKGSKDLSGNALVNDHVWTFTTGAATVITLPVVSATDPINAATNIALNQKIAATFSRTMDASTITASTFIVMQGAVSVAGFVSYTGTTATFAPSQNLTANTIYSVIVTTGAKDLSGNALANNYVWSFTTGAGTVITPPTVTSTDPANAAVGVALNQKIAATFSKTMDAATITTATFTVKQGSTPVSGFVSYSGTTATFAPSVNLSPNTLYTVTILTGATDLAGNPLASNYVWTFTTGAAVVITPPTVASTIPLNAAVAVPLNQKVSATFSKSMDASTITTATFTLMQGTTFVSGTVSYVGFTATYTPSSNLVANTTYTATITTGAFDLAGNALANNYVWSFTTGAAPVIILPTVILTDPLNAATGVALNKSVSATFSKVMDAATLTTATFTLKQGLISVSGFVSYSGLTAIFNPASNLSANTVYTATITTAAKDTAGNGMANNYVWSFTTVAAALPPAVVSTIPLNGATGVALNQKLDAAFSKIMDASTITTSTFTLKHGVTSVPGFVSYSGLTATFTPSSNLLPNTLYTATITTGAKDTAGTPLANNYVWSFTTLIVTAPTVVSTDPLNLATGVALNKKVTATFSRVMDASTINTSTFTLKQGLNSIAGFVTYSGLMATFTPASNLAANTIYTATITTGAKDTAGTAIVSNFTWSFTTVLAIPPTVVSTDPINGATGVPLDKTITATFSKAMDDLTITSTTFIVKQGSTSVSGFVSYSGLTATFNPTSSLWSNAVYTATITTGAKDSSGTPLVSNYVWSFTTALSAGGLAVNLGTAARFAILSNSAITNIPTSSITGDVGISPGGRSSITGLTLPEVIGTIFAADDAIPVPAMLILAKADAEAAYLDAIAATRGTPTPISGNINGLTLVPGLYQSGTSIQISPGGIVYLDAQGDVNAVFVIRSATSITTSATSNVILTNGAKAKNVFWSAGSAVTLGTNSIMKGTIIASTSISLLTGARLDGRALIQSAAAGQVSLDQNIIVRP